MLNLEQNGNNIKLIGANGGGFGKVNSTNAMITQKGHEAVHQLI